MDRRELLKMIAVLTGGAVVGSEFFLSGCTAGGKAEVGFTPANISFLNEVGETILPATSSPGAKAAQVGEFMKVYVTDCYPQESQDAFIKGINQLDEACDKMHKKSFMDCSPEQRQDLLVSLEKEAKEYNKKPEEDDKMKRQELKDKGREYEFVGSPRHYYTMIKQLTLLGFFTSKVGAKEALRYEAVPGGMMVHYRIRKVIKHGLNNEYTLKKNNMQYDRRKFIKLTGAATTGLALSSATGISLLSSCNDDAGKIKTFGLQLYSLRDDMPKDPKGVLKQVAAFGYKQVESYQHDKLGMYWGMSNTEFKKYMDDLGMTIVSSHTDIGTDFEKKAAEAAAIGMKYLICPHKGAQKSLDDFKRFADEFNQKGEICKKNGIRFAYHNHDYSFVPMDGQFPQDVMMQNTDPALVDFEMDIYWVVTGNQDPEVWLKKYPKRFRLCHVKDRIKNSTEHGASCILGEGSIDFPKILKTAKANGVETYVVEHERYDNTTPLKAAEADAAYMKKFKM